MSTNQERLFRVMFDVRKNARNLSFSDNLPPSVFHLLLMIRKKGKEMEYMGNTCLMIEGHELFDCMEVSKPAISRLLRNCEAKGYIQRLGKEEDRRAMNVVLLDKGLEELKISEEQVKTAVANIFDELGEDDIEELIRIFSKLNQVISSIKERKS